MHATGCLKLLLLLLLTVVVIIINGDGGCSLLAAYIGGSVAQAAWLGSNVGGHLTPC